MMLILLTTILTAAAPGEPHRHLEEAKEYYREQEHGKAFEAFLLALPTTVISAAPPMTFEEKELYEQALQVYLNAQGTSIGNASQSLIDSYEPLLNFHPEFYRLGFLVAAAFANCGNFPKFFDLFFNSYSVCPDHYLALKIKAILHIKLFERCCPSPYKELQRVSILKNLDEAIDRFPYDTSLYRLRIFFANDNEKEGIVAASLNRILDVNMIIPRGELEFFIQNALDYADLELAERFLNRAKTWVPYSRTITAAQQLIDKRRSLEKS